MAILTIGPGRIIRGAEPLETVREAFRASSSGLTSGVGTGRYRHYEAAPGGEWQLKIDADMQVRFAGRKYHVDLTFARDEMRKLNSRRLIYDGAAITDVCFTPDAHPTGAHGRIFMPANDGAGLARAAWGDFPWDVSDLAKNVWDPDELIKNRSVRPIEINETPEGDLVGSYSFINASGQQVGSVRFECPRRFGFNLAMEQVFNRGEARPARESSLQWKQGPNGLWYVTSLLVTSELRNEKRAVKQIRAIIMYSRFEPNAAVDALEFTEKSLKLPVGTPIVDVRPEVSK